MSGEYGAEEFEKEVGDGPRLDAEKGEDKHSSTRRRAQNNEAARRFRARRKELNKMMKRELDESREREKNAMILLDQARKFMYAQNVTLIKFPTLRDIEQCIQNYTMITSEPIGSADDLGPRAGLSQAEVMRMASESVPPPPLIPGAGTAELATAQQVERLKKQLEQVERNLMRRLDGMLPPDGAEGAAAKRRRFAENALPL